MKAFLPAKIFAFVPALLFGWSVQAQTILNIGNTNSAFNTLLGDYGTVSTTTAANTLNVANINTTANAWSEGIGGTGFTVKQALETFDLVVLGSGTGSGTLGNSTIRTNWANLNTAILSTSPFQTRQDRLGWFSGTSAIDATLGGVAGADVNIASGNPLGLTDGAADWYVNTAIVQSPLVTSTAGDGFTLATFNSNNTGGTRNTGPAAFLWEVGDEFGGAASGIAAPQRRAFFALDQNATNLNMLTTTGRAALGSTIEWALVPEPSSTALLAGAGIFCLMRRRGLRKAG